MNEYYQKRNSTALTDKRSRELFGTENTVPYAKFCSASAELDDNQSQAEEGSDEQDNLNKEIRAHSPPYIGIPLLFVCFIA